MLTIDKRELITLRREEANACIHYGLYQAATLTACSGIEMLLNTLYDELMEKLTSDDPPLANELRGHRREMLGDNEPENEWGLGRWIAFYREFNIFSELRNNFNYSFSEFKMPTLRRANAEWVKCKHRPYQVARDKALMITNYLNAYLEETRHPLGVGDTQLRTVGEFSRRWLEEWEIAIGRWFVQNRAAPQGEILQPLTKLLALVVSLIVDARVGIAHKTRLMVAANYVFSSVDLMPEDDLDVSGLVDDGAVLVLTLYWLLHHSGFEADIVRSNWPVDNDIISEIDRLEKYIQDNNEALFKGSGLRFGESLIWATIRRIATEGPEALWQNYWKEAY